MGRHARHHRPPADVPPRLPPACWPHPRAGRQVDQPSRADVRLPRGRGDAHHRACWRARTYCGRRPQCGRSAPRSTPRRTAIWHVAGRGIGGLTEPDDVLDMGNSGTAARLLCGILASHDLFAVMTGDASPAPPSDAAGHRAALGLRRALCLASGWPLAARDRRGAGGAAARIPGAGRLRAGEIRRPAGRPERAGPHAGRGAGGHARSHREHAAPFRGRGAGASRPDAAGRSRFRASRSCAPPMSPFPAIRRPPPSRSSPRCWFRARGFTSKAWD